MTTRYYRAVFADEKNAKVLKSKTFEYVAEQNIGRILQRPPMLSVRDGNAWYFSFEPGKEPIAGVANYEERHLTRLFNSFIRNEYLQSLGVFNLESVLLNCALSFPPKPGQSSPVAHYRIESPDPMNPYHLLSNLKTTAFEENLGLVAEGKHALAVALENVLFVSYDSRERSRIAAAPTTPSELIEGFERLLTREELEYSRFDLLGLLSKVPIPEKNQVTFVPHQLQ